MRQVVPDNDVAADAGYRQQPSSSRANDRGGYHEGRRQSAHPDVQNAQIAGVSLSDLGVLCGAGRKSGASQRGVQGSPTDIDMRQERSIRLCVTLGGGFPVRFDRVRCACHGLP